MLRRIVCATDLSPSALVATRYAASIARAFDGTVELVTAWSWYDDIDEYALVRPEALEEWKQKHEAKLALAVEALAKQGVSASGKLVEGEPPRAIVEHAAATKADLLVVGTEGRRGIAHALLGSVAERILRTSEVPVLAVPKTWAVADDARFAPKSILVPVDLEPLSAELVRVATDLARRAHARVAVVHAWDSAVMASEGPTAEADESRMTARFTRWMEANAPKTTPHVDSVVRRGVPFDVIEDVVEERGVDLVVMATAGRTGIEHFMLGSLTERVLRSVGRPVLAYRRPRTERS